MILLLPCRLMRDFRAIVRVGCIDVLDGWHRCAVRRIVASEFVGDQPARFTPLAFQEAAKEAYGRLFVPSWLHQKINVVTILIDGSPQILLLSLNGDKHLIKVPSIP